ncbi:hypothetical protein GF385_04510 [Candidatus Dependentiae bacterium]|nr:hypothetical protein [Candidatus Dependentiae bacterium]
MRRIKRRTLMGLVLLTFCVSSISSLLAVEQIKKTSSISDFSRSITNKELDRYTGDLYITTSRRNDSNDTYAIANASRTATNFSPIAPTGRAYQIEEGVFGTLNYTNTAAEYATYREYPSSQSTKDLKVIKIAAGTSASVKGCNLGRHTDMSNICTTNGEEPFGLRGFTLIETSTRHIFLRVLGDGKTTTSFDNCGILGILAVDPDADNFVRAGANDNDRHMTLTLDGHRGRTDGDGAFLRVDSNDPHLTTTPEVTDMYWDENLQTLFISGNLTAKLPSGGSNFYMAITKVKFDNDKRHLVISDILPNDVDAAANDDSTIFASNVASGGTERSPRIFKIRTMKTSSGLDYLIVQGGIGDSIARVGNQYWALRYDNHSTKGFVRQNNSAANNTTEAALTSGFTRTAAGNALDGGNLGSLQIGGMVAPWASTSTTTHDIEVVGDTVYVTADQGRDENNDPGVWASTAMFDKDGVIIGWTRWERVFLSENSDTLDAAKFFAVDAYNNKVWQISEDSSGEPRTVRRLKWDTSGFAAASLPYNINQAFASDTHKDITAVLDVPLGTPGLDGASNSDNSFALFGGYERVVFARTKYGDANDVTTSFILGTDTTDILNTTLVGAGTVRCLGWSRSPFNYSGYFFAGTDKGLWIYTADGGAGASKLTDLTSAPFDDGSWSQFASTTITGAVTAIDSDGENVYVVEQDLTSIGTITSKLWRITIGTSKTTMEGNTTLISQSGSDGMPLYTLYTGFTLTTTVGIHKVGEEQNRACHAGLISTNAGVFQSRIFLKDLDDAGSNDADTWAGVDVRRAYTDLKGIKRVPTSMSTADGAGFRFYGTAFEDSTNGYNYFQDSTLRLFGITASEIGDHQQYITDTDTNGEFDLDTTKENRILSLWSDGGRRFATRFNGPDKIAETSSNQVNMLWALPFYPGEWNMTAPATNSAVDGQKIYWVENISGLGIILAGTTNGVIALQ